MQAFFYIFEAIGLHLTVRLLLLSFCIIALVASVFPFPLLYAISGSHASNLLANSPLIVSAVLYNFFGLVLSCFMLLRSIYFRSVAPLLHSIPSAACFLQSTPPSDIFSCISYLLLLPISYIPYFLLLPPQTFHISFCHNHLHFTIPITFFTCIPFPHLGLPSHTLHISFCCRPPAATHLIGRFASSCLLPPPLFPDYPVHTPLAFHLTCFLPPASCMAGSLSTKFKLSFF